MQILDSKIKNYYFVIAFIILEAFTAVYWHDNFDQMLANHAEDLQKESRTAFLNTLTSFGLIAQTYVDQVVNQPDIKYILRQSQDSAGVRTSQAILNKKLANSYHLVLRQGVREMYFFNHQNQLINRFYEQSRMNPTIEVRTPYSVKLANTKQIPLYGFEENRVFNGFRYVFPVKDSTQISLGVVSLDVDFNTIRKQMYHTYPKSTTLIINRNNIRSSSMRNSVGAYQRTDIHAQYIVESKVAQEDEKINTDSITLGTKKQINKILQVLAFESINSQKTFTLNVPVRGQFYAVSFIPILNFEKVQIAYLVTYVVDNEYAQIESYFYSRMAFSTIILLLIVAFVNFELRSIFRIRQKNRELEFTTNNLRHSDLTKERFLSFIAEDLKNPFPFMIGYAKAVVDEYDVLSDDKKREFVHIILNAAESGSHLVENLLEWSRLQREEFQPNPEEFNVAEVIDMVIQNQYDLARDKQINLYSKVSYKESNLIYADKKNVITVVRNLINNAIKFSPEGAVVKVSAVNFKGMLRIVVEDSGLGIKKYRLSTIFEGYRDASQSENRSTRLGLMLCKDLCTRNNGDISIESEEGQGTKVLVDMPTEKHFKLFNKSKKLLATRFTMPHRKDTSKKKTSKPIN